MSSKHVSINGIEPDLSDAQLCVPAGIDSLLEGHSLSDRKLLRRKPKLERERGFFAVAIIRAELDARAKCPAVCLREE